MVASIHRSQKSRHLVLRLESGDVLPDAICAALKDEQVVCGWLRGSGVVSNVDLRGYNAAAGSLGDARRIEGPVQVLSLEGSVGSFNGEPSVSMRALLARETDRGLEPLAGEIASARAVAFEVLVTAFDDLALQKAHDERAGVWVLGAPGDAAQGRGPARPASPPAWSSALEASDAASERGAEPRGPKAATAGLGPAIPARPQRPGPDLDAPFPEPGDSVEHFAFGRCDVVKSDGDRLHLRVHKDGRIREIALGMLRVSHLDGGADGKRHFKLERRM